MSPSASNLNYSSSPPFPPEWLKMETENFPANKPARDLAHQARSVASANWPPLNSPASVGPSYLNQCRSLSNELADAALDQHLQGDDAAAFETLRDQIQLADCLENAPEKKYMIVLLVSVGIREEAMDRLNVVMSNAVLTSDQQNQKGIQTSVVRDLLSKLAKHTDARAEIAKDEAVGADPVARKNMDRFMRVLDGMNAECKMSAVALACHLYRFDKGAWPTSLDPLLAYLPILPIDPFGDGQQPIGYTVIKAGLPDGSDRPLVYCRADRVDGLFYRSDQPFYCQYPDDGSSLPRNKRKHGGQFRDIAAWQPKPDMAPATQPIAN